jgi:hypothetical protein
MNAIKKIVAIKDRMFLITVIVLGLIVPQTSNAQEIQGEILLDTLDFKIIRVWGTHTERGYAYGYITGNEINDIFDNYIKPMFGNYYNTARNLILAEGNFQINEVYIMEAQAIIDGMTESGTNTQNLDVTDMLVGNCMLDIQGILGKSSGLGCSSLMSWGDATTNTDLNGEAIITRHLDWSSNTTLLSNHLIVIHQPTEESEQNWMLIGFTGMMGALSGVNNYLGVFQHVMADYTSNGQQNKSYKPIWFAMRDALEKSDYNSDGNCNVIDIKNSLDDSPNGFASGYLINGLSDNVSSDDLTAIVAEITPTAPTHVYRNNTFPDSIPGDNLYSANNQIARNNLMHFCNRYNNIRNHIGDGTLIGPEENWDLMRDWSHQSNNIQVMQFAPAINHFRIGVKNDLPAYQSEYIDLDLNDLLNSVTFIKQHKNKTSLTFYPNPTVDQIIISDMGAVPVPYTIEVINFNGMVVQKIEITEKISSFKLPLSNYGKGIYTIHIHGKQLSSRQKIIKI